MGDIFLLLHISGNLDSDIVNFGLLGERCYSIPVIFRETLISPWTQLDPLGSGV